MSSIEDMFKANQEIWNQRTRIHKSSSFYDVAGFLTGKEVLTEIELRELTNVRAKNLLHLQCHFGIDTLAWARHGANVTGIDFSQESIMEAKDLAKKAKLKTEFYCGNIYDTTALIGDRKFDIIYTSYGVIGWLPDLDKWAGIIRRHLSVGGVFYLAEFHPVVWMFNDEFSKIVHPYHNSHVIVTENAETYTNGELISGKEYGWNHSLSEVINSLLKNNLRITQLNEYPYSPYASFKNMASAGPGRWNIKGLEGKIPLVYTLMAVPL